jgi:hypothetical protein
MATNAILAVKHQDGSVKSVSVHWDGNTLLPILDTHYTTPELAEELVSLGSISSLGERIHPIDRHSFDEREEGTTTYYHRDRGDSLRINKFADVKEWQKYMKGGIGCDYLYWFDSQMWQYI